MKGYERNYLVRCMLCGFVFCQRKPSIEELKSHYSLYPRANDISNITKKRYAALLDSFEPYRKTNNIIDVGCGDGYFLESAKERKWNVFGTEFTSKAIDICQQKGIEMTASPLDPKHYSPDFFDVITSFEVIEHLNTPVSELASFKDILRKGGIVYVTTPNLNSISRNFLKSRWNVIQYPEHLSYYTTQTLTALFRQFNFKCIQITTNGISINRFKASTLPANSTRAFSNYDESLRQKAEDEIIFEFVKAGINAALNILRKGDAIKAFFQKQ
jgi:2-polyprenyl-3-methyl-5-hydroxy-6-metoxy-1,4-benzoquinol methylase